MIEKIVQPYKKFMAKMQGPSAARNIFSPVFLTWYFLRKRIEDAKPFFCGKVLDIGCGKKPYAELISKSAKYIGLDYPLLAGKSYDRNDVSCPDIYGDGTELPFRSESLDGIINTQVLEYIPDPEKFVREMSRVLKSGGAVVMSIPLTYPVHHVSHDYYRFTESGMVYLLNKSGLNIIWIKANGGFWVVLGHLFLYFTNFRFLFRPRHDVIWVFFSVVRFIVTPVILILNSIINMCALLGNYIHPEPYITLNYSLVAKKVSKISGKGN